MRREMRRKDLIMTQKEAEDLLRRGEYGVAAGIDADGAPYGLPISYVCLNGAVYIHGAKAGHKWECLQNGAQICFTVVGRVEPRFDKGSFGTLYESVMVFGRAAEVADEEEKWQALARLCEKYQPTQKDAVPAYVNQSAGACRVAKITVEALCGKTRF